MVPRSLCPLVNVGLTILRIRSWHEVEIRRIRVQSIGDPQYGHPANSTIFARSNRGNARIPALSEEEENSKEFLARHVRDDLGEFDEEDRQTNELTPLQRFKIAEIDNSIKCRSVNRTSAFLDSCQHHEPEWRNA